MTPRGRDTLLTTLTHRAMACEFAVMLPASMRDRAEAAWDALESLDVIEAELTVYRETSAVSRINRDAADHPVVVDRHVFDLLCQCVALSRVTGGAFDVTSGPLIRAWGFDRRAGRKPTDDELRGAMAITGWDKLVLRADQRSVAFAVPGMQINLGAIGKGYAIDRLGESLKVNGITDFLIHGGQSSVLAAGRPGDQEDEGWLVGVAHPTKPQRRLAGVRLRDAAIGTSGSGKQFFHHRGRRYGHVIDPRSGFPAGDLLSLTLMTSSAMIADAVATGLFVMGAAAAIDWCDGHPDVLPPDRSAMLMAGGTDRQDDVTLSTWGVAAWVDRIDQNSP